MKRNLYLIRHGTTKANLENRFAGRTSEPLHLTGIEQISKLGEKLQSCRISRIFSGPLPRVRQSAEILQEMLYAPVTIDAALTEIHIPHWDGYTKQDIREKYGAEYPTWIESPENFKLPCCETLAEVQTRAISALERFLTTETKGDLLVVSHLIVIRCIILFCRNLPIKNFRTIKIDNGSVTHLAGKKGGGFTVVTERKPE